MRAISARTRSWETAERKKIVDGTYAYGNWKGGRDFENRQLRLRDFDLAAAMVGSINTRAGLISESVSQTDRI